MDSINSLCLHKKSWQTWAYTQGQVFSSKYMPKWLQTTMRICRSLDWFVLLHRLNSYSVIKYWCWLLTNVMIAMDKSSRDLPSRWPRSRTDRKNKFTVLCQQQSTALAQRSTGRRRIISFFAPNTSNLHIACVVSTNRITGRGISAS